MIFSLVKNVKYDGKLHDSTVLPSAASDWSVHEKLVRVPYCIGRARTRGKVARICCNREKRGRAFLRKVGREGTDHAHGCVLRSTRARFTGKVSRFVRPRGKRGTRATHSVNSHGRDRALGKWKEFFCIDWNLCSVWCSYFPIFYKFFDFVLWVWIF